MDFLSFKKKYNDLIFAPLDFPVPPLDIDKLLQWSKNRPDFEYEELAARYPDATKEKFDKMMQESAFPLVTSYRVCRSQSGWNEEFIADFPQILDWVETLPLVKGKRFTFGWLYQNDVDYLKNLNKPLCSPIHVDEIGGFGLRYYLGNKKNNLFFYGTKNTIHDVPNITNDNFSTDVITHLHIDNKLQFSKEGYPIPNENFYNKPVKINTTENTSFILGQEKAAHFIMHEHTPKFTFIVQPIGKIEHRYDWNAIDKNIQTVFQAKPEEFIWYEDLVA